MRVTAWCSRWIPPVANFSRWGRAYVPEVWGFSAEELVRNPVQAVFDRLVDNNINENLIGVLEVFFEFSQSRF